jgi:hypothetical protein
LPTDSVEPFVDATVDSAATTDAAVDAAVATDTVPPLLDPSKPTPTPVVSLFVTDHRPLNPFLSTSEAVPATNEPSANAAATVAAVDAAVNASAVADTGPALLDPSNTDASCVSLCHRPPTVESLFDDL